MIKKLISTIGLTLILACNGCSEAKSSANKLEPSSTKTTISIDAEMDALITELNTSMPVDDAIFTILVDQVIQRLPITQGSNPTDTVKALYRVVRIGKDPLNRKKAILALSTLVSVAGNDAEVIIPYLIQLLGNIAMRPDDPTTPYYELRSTIHTALGMRGFGEKTVEHIKTIFQDARQLDADRAQAVVVATKIASSGTDGGIKSDSQAAKNLLGIFLETMDIPESKNFPLRRKGQTNQAILESLKYLAAAAQPALLQLRKEFDLIQARVFSDHTQVGDIDHGTQLRLAIEAIEKAVEAAKSKNTKP